MKFIIEFIKRLFFGKSQPELPIITSDVLIDDSINVESPVVEVEKPKLEKTIKKVKSKNPLTDTQKQLVASAKEFGFTKTSNTNDLHYLGAIINVEKSTIYYTNKNGNKITKLLREPYDKSINKFLMRYVK